MVICGTREEGKPVLQKHENVAGLVGGVVSDLAPWCGFWNKALERNPTSYRSRFHKWHTRDIYSQVSYPVCHEGLNVTLVLHVQVWGCRVCSVWQEGSQQWPFETHRQHQHTNRLHSSPQRSVSEHYNGHVPTIHFRLFDISFFAKKKKKLIWHLNQDEILPRLVFYIH